MKKAIIIAATAVVSVNALAGQPLQGDVGYHRVTEMDLVARGGNQVVINPPEGGGDQRVQTLKLATKDAAGSLVGVSCTLANDKGSWTLVTPATVTIARSSEDLHIECAKAGYRNVVGVLSPTTVKLAVADSDLATAASVHTVTVPLYQPSFTVPMNTVTLASKQ